MVTGIEISAALIKKNGQLTDRNLNRPQRDMVKSKLPKIWQRSVINFERFSALRASNSDLESKVSAMTEGVAYLALEMDGELRLLSVDELSTLEETSLDEASAIAQLTP